MKLEQLQKADLVLMAEIKIQLRITIISKMIESIHEQVEEMEELYEIVRTKQRWVKL